MHSVLLKQSNISSVTDQNTELSSDESDTKNESSQRIMFMCYSFIAQDLVDFSVVFRFSLFLDFEEY